LEKPVDTKAEIIALLEGRSEESLEKIRVFIQDEDEVAYHKFLYPIDPDFAEELEERAAEARTIIENVREIDATLRGLDQGRIKIQ
jgi:hypothetical protein